MHLSAYMKHKNLSDQDFAVLIDRTRATVSRIRRGKVRPDWVTVERINKATNGVVTANDFLPDAIPEAAE